MDRVERGRGPCRLRSVDAPLARADDHRLQRTVDIEVDGVLAPVVQPLPANPFVRGQHGHDVVVAIVGLVVQQDATHSADAILPGPLSVGLNVVVVHGGGRQPRHVDHHTAPK